MKEKFEENQQSGSIQLKEPIDLQSIFNGQVFEINSENAVKEDIQQFQQEDDIAAFVKACNDFDSDEELLTNTPFDEIAKKMVNVTSDGKIKKRIRREGTGTTPPDLAVCSILYFSYLELNDEPTDFTYMKKPYQFRLGTACLPGLNVAVASMKVTEKAQFLVHPDFAFGSMGHPPRIPPNSTFLFNIELVKFSDSGPALQFDHLTLDDKKQFSKAYKTALGLMESAKEHYKNNAKLAIRDYNKALGLIEECNLKDFQEQEEQQKLKLRILTNLAVCHNKDGYPKKACTACNDIYIMVKNTSLKVPAKVYFNNGRALLEIGDFQRAKEKLLIAQRMEPHNIEISNELLKVNEKIQPAKQKEKELAKKLLSKSEIDQPTPSTSSQVFELNAQEEMFLEVFAQRCEDFKASDETQFSIPQGLTVKEKNIMKIEAEKRGLKFRESSSNVQGKLRFFITKQ